MALTSPFWPQAAQLLQLTLLWVEKGDGSVRIHVEKVKVKVLIYGHDHIPPDLRQLHLFGFQSAHGMWCRRR